MRNESCYRYVDCLTVHRHYAQTYSREATMASELSGRRCDVMIWHDTNHRKDILGSVYHRYWKADQNWDGSLIQIHHLVGDVAVPLLIPFIGLREAPSSHLPPTSQQLDRRGRGTRSYTVVDTRHGPFLALCKCYSC
jgi:hypothetical protein